MFCFNIRNAKIVDHTLCIRLPDERFIQGQFFGRQKKCFLKIPNREIEDVFEETISYHDYSESFYHAILIGLLSKTGYIVESNFENGLGRSDIAVKDRGARKAVVIEVKVSNAEAHLEADCKKALAQIREKRYADKIKTEDYRTVLSYGMAFYKKTCLVKA